MASKYESGGRLQVLWYMAECAIMDRQAYLDSLSELEYDGHNEWRKLRAETLAEIRDFRKMQETTKPTGYA